MWSIDARRRDLFGVRCDCVPIRPGMLSIRIVPNHSSPNPVARSIRARSNQHSSQVAANLRSRNSSLSNGERRRPVRKWLGWARRGAAAGRSIEPARSHTIAAP